MNARWITVARVVLTASMILAFVSEPAGAAQGTLAPAVVSRIVNPSDAGDVRLLIRFEIPEGIRRSDIIVATLRVRTSGETEIPFSIGPLQSEWSVQDDWANARSKLVGSPGFDGEGNECMIMSNHVKPGEGGETDQGIELIVTPWVRGWVSGSNHGLAIRGVASRDDDLSDHLPAAAAPEIELVILYLD